MDTPLSIHDRGRDATGRSAVDRVAAGSVATAGHGPAGAAATGGAMPRGTPPRGTRRAGLQALDGPAGMCTELVELVEQLHEIDRLTAAVVDRLARFQDTGEVEAATGVPLELWLAAAGRRTRSDRRMLQTAADVLARMPALSAGFAAGQVSWAQTRAIVLACERLPTHLTEVVDGALAGEIDALTDTEPDALVSIVGQAVASVAPQAARQPTEPTERFVSIQPRLDGTGGRLYGELDPVGLTIVDDALSSGCPPPPGRSRDHVGENSHGSARRAHARSLGRWRADRLVALCWRHRPARGPHGAGTAPRVGQRPRA